MPSDHSDGAPVSPITGRGRSWPALRQFVVVLENKVGALHELLRQIERDDLCVVGLSIFETTDCAVARIVSSHYERTRELLDLAGRVTFETDVLGVLLPDDRQPHAAVCSALLCAELNVHYMYPLMYRRHGCGSVVLHVDNIDDAIRVLKDDNQTLITEDDLIQYGEQFPC